MPKISPTVGIEWTPEEADHLDGTLDALYDAYSFVVGMRALIGVDHPSGMESDLLRAKELLDAVRHGERYAIS